ncbi:hypothetical protein Q4S45_20105 [Massilia sp. R2A-15]|uniref:HzsA-related protein n=1 Tax=Massilia sp. R2A-15 TaxID=3064278 RepID=UPI0027353B86|nr:hypothetical protein [Massilia sp. R2A-15]WLI88982.1 hypothetical protein Q4S45_20105 [Massilia sp. R2A-15]
MRIAVLRCLPLAGAFLFTAVAAAPVTPYPILFVTQVPLHTDVAARLSAFGNHMGGVTQAPRGGGLMLRYPDGTLRNLTREAGFDDAAVREPAVHPGGERAVFSMLAGAAPNAVWQLYEVRGLAKGQRASIARVARQPAGYNNVAPLYASGDAMLFASDRPRDGAAHLYPQLDEYEATPTVTGIWRLDPASGALRILNHAPSGAFTPILDSYGRVLFTRWDHLQQDQLAERDRDASRNGVAPPFRSFNYAAEDARAPKLDSRAEPFPESRSGSTGPYGAVSGFITNFFTIWSMNEDGSNEETLNHVGQHELAFGFLTPSFRDDPNLSNHTVDTHHANRLAIRREGGLFHLREDPRRRGSYIATAARESGSFTTGPLVRLSGAPALNGDQMTVTALTAMDAGDAMAGGRFRNPLPLSNGVLVASHTSAERAPEEGAGLPDLRLRVLARGSDGKYRAGAPLTAGIRADGTGPQSYRGVLWELDAVEVRPRLSPPRRAAAFEAPERAVLAEERVSEAALRDWLVRRDLALVVTRDQTSRDRADLQQPFNLRVPGGVKTVSKAMPGGKVYDIAHFQLFQGDQLRAYPGRAGRRVIAQPLHDGANPPNPQGPAGSVRIAADGSTAAFVPARRALTWQTTDRAGTPVVRERNWITFQAGEMRTCASCHGTNTANQAGLGAPSNKPQALRELLKYWKTLPK